MLKWWGQFNCTLRLVHKQKRIRDKFTAYLAFSPSQIWKIRRVRQHRVCQLLATFQRAMLSGGNHHVRSMQHCGNHLFFWYFAAKTDRGSYALALLIVITGLESRCWPTARFSSQNELQKMWKGEKDYIWTVYWWSCMPLGAQWTAQINWQSHAIPMLTGIKKEEFRVYA